jgi:hypothetical protein
MHKAVICLTRASSEQEAHDNVVNFLEDYGDGDVWDWYVIGGRWSGTLNPLNKEFMEKAEVHFKAAYPENENPFLTQNMVKEQDAALQEIWDTLGGEGNHPYGRDQYKDVTANDDILPLSTCQEVVKEWTINREAILEECWAKLLAADADRKNGKYDMRGYYAKEFHDWAYDKFSFNSNVYDIDERTNNPEHAFEDVNEYYAVIVDMHN